MKLYRKIDIFVAVDGVWKYACSTQQAKTLKQAKQRFFDTHMGFHIDTIKAVFSDRYN